MIVPEWTRTVLESDQIREWGIRAELETANLKGCPMFMFTVPWPLHEYYRFEKNVKFDIFIFCRLCI